MHFFSELTVARKKPQNAEIIPLCFYPEKGNVVFCSSRLYKHCTVLAILSCARARFPDGRAGKKIRFGTYSICIEKIMHQTEYMAIHSLALLTRFVH